MAQIVVMPRTDAMMTVFQAHPDYLHSLKPMPLKMPAGVGSGEFMAPEEVSDVVAWLAAPGSASVSGTQIPVDRGELKY